MSIIAFILCGYAALCLTMAAYGWTRPTGGIDPRAQVVVVLGGGARGGQLQPVGQARVAAGVASLGPGQTLHLTGGLAGGGSEAALMAAEAKQLGVEPHRITQEHESRTTQQNALFSQPIIGERAIVIVSDNFHLARAAMLFRGHGYTVTALRGTTYRRGMRRALWFFAREGLSGPINLLRLIAWGLAGGLGASRDWRIRTLT